MLPDGRAERALLSDAIAPLANEAEPIRVLEAGCGQRWPLEVGVPLHITGIDTDPDALRIRRETHNDLDAEIVGDLRSVPIPEGSFDLVYCGFVLEHIEGAEAVLERLVRATRPGGRLIIRVPDGDSIYGFFAKHSPFRLHVLYKRHVEGFHDAGKPGHAPYPTVYDDVVSLRGLRAFAKQHGLRVVAEYGMNSFPPMLRRAQRVMARSQRLLTVVSRHRLSTTHNNLGLVLERPRA